MRNTPSLPSLLGPLCPGMVAPDSVLSMSPIDLWHLYCVQTNDFSQIKLLEILLLDHLTAYKQMTDV